MGCLFALFRNRPRIGYARVSTADQNLDTQMAALEAAGRTIIRTETGTGATLEGRPDLGTILDFIHRGETLVVTRIDRLICSGLGRFARRTSPTESRAPSRVVWR